MKHPTVRLFDSVREQLASEMAADFERLDEGCESPIESVLYMAMALHHRIYYGMWPCKLKQDCLDYWITKQEKVGTYRVDFVVRFRTEYMTQVNCVVEADGHDFHEKTKDQAAYDRKRDRELQALGFLVLRFTGSEIYRDPWKCADEIFEKIKDFSNEQQHMAMGLAHA